MIKNVPGIRDDFNTLVVWIFYGIQYTLVTCYS